MQLVSTGENAPFNDDGPSKIELLSSEILLQIQGSLSFQDIINCSRTCRLFFTLFGACHLEGRNDTLKKIRYQLSNDAAEQKVHVITGMAGIGKSIICRTYAYGINNQYEHIFHVDASSSATINRHYMEIAKTLEFQLLDGRLALSTARKPWLLILDNADDKDLDYQNFIPSSTNGTILITSRNPQLHIYATAGRTELDGLDQKSILNLFFKVSSPDRNPETELQTTALTGLLGYNPLATLIAGTYVKNRRLSLSGEDLVGPVIRYVVRGQSIHNTFETSIHCLSSMTEENQDALGLLYVLRHRLLNHSTSAPKDIWKQCLVRDHDLDDFEEDFRFIKALNALRSLSLVLWDREKGPQDFRLYPLVSLWLCQREFLDTGSVLCPTI